MRRPSLRLGAALAVALLFGVPAAARGATVTLITGDRVLVREDRKAATVIPADRPGRKASFRMWRADGELHVVPSDVARLVPRVLDPALFNVTELTRMGYDDARSDSLPLIVRGQRPATLESVRTLRSVGATGSRLPRGRRSRSRAWIAYGSTPSCAAPGTAGSRRPPPSWTRT